MFRTKLIKERDSRTGTNIKCLIVFLISSILCLVHPVFIVGILISLGWMMGNISSNTDLELLKK